MRNIGKMGERYFDGLCASVGITSNKSETDETGWDYFIEFPYTPNERVPFDEQNASFECKVQIKSTDGKKGAWSIKLSNLKRFAKTPLPTFYIFFEYDGLDEPQSGYIVHVDESLIEKILKKLRELNESEQDIKLNKKFFTVHYDEPHKLKELTGECLKQSLEQHIGNSIEEYVSNKERILKTVGFSDGAGEITFSTKGEDNTLKLVKTLVGLSNSTEVYDIVARRKRFGILSKKPAFNYPVAQLELNKIEPQSIGKIKFKENKYSSYISLPAKLYISPLNTVIPDKFKLFRVAGTSFEFLINPITSASTYTMTIQEEYHDFSELHETVKLFEMLSKPNLKPIGELDFDIFPKKRFNIVTHSDNPIIDKDFQKTIKNVDIIATEFGIKKNLQINIHELVHYGIEFQRFSDTLTLSQGLTRAEFQVENGLNVNDEIICVFFNLIPVGNHLVGGVFSLKTKKFEALSDNFYRVTSDKLIIEKKVVISTGEAITSDEIKTMVQETQKQYDLPGTTSVSLFIE